MEKNHFLKSAQNLTIEQKIGQLVLAQTFGRFRGNSAREYKASEKLVTNYHVAGFKLYHGYALGTLMFTSHAQSMAATPLFIASDLETGLGQQIVDAPRFPPLSAFGVINNSDLAYQAAFFTAKEALQLGINMIFSPLLDLHTSEDTYFGLRSIGSDPHISGEIGRQFVLGISDAGAISTVKYFPGNGRQLFCNDGSTLNHQSYDHLNTYEWIPFKAAIAAGVDAVMLSHGAFPQLDNTKWSSDAGTRPAALSRRIVQKYLRDELGFKGLVVTDALNLPFLRKHSIRKIAYHAIVAGADLLVALTTPQDAIDAIKGIYDALESGKVTEEQINLSVARILRAKNKINQSVLTRLPLSKIDISIGNDKTTELIDEISRRSIRLIKKPQSGFPIQKRPLTIGCLVIGSSQMLDQVKSDQWVPWHKLDPHENVNIEWNAITTTSEKTDFPHLNFSQSEFVVIALLQLDRLSREILDSYIEYFQNMDIRIILAIPISLNAAKSLNTTAWAVIWMPDFQQASRHALFSVIIGELQSEEFLS